MNLTKEELKKICPNLKDDKASIMTDLINKVCPRYKIDTPKRLQAFLAQVLHESGEFSIKLESLYYTHAERIVDVWPSRFNLTGTGGKLNANNYIKNEQKLANTVYANRMSNGDFSSGDGYRYRGGGYLQLTGKESYSAYAKYLNKSIEETADLVHTSDEYALDAACWEYAINKKLLESSDNGDFVNITKKINGGLIGQDDRVKYYNLCKKYLIDDNSSDNIA
jgi:putative chitinase